MIVYSISGRLVVVVHRSRSLGGTDRARAGDADIATSSIGSRAVSCRPTQKGEERKYASVANTNDS